ncbi:5-oxoprolinase subunit PxpB [[Clostridium] hylemonae]|uniref:TIGR00370 family protein n=1 Tax=[Clostridium] hylemonae DSM 15053 TaxID=553973 RepID=C0BZN8_9FIRM|nr:5-oxoprolinase subunit PxpB [[Clostridium] hylemonae]EEG74616.1 TIGR00370 family protein [[Clostridium] hylemonae DSM 15053]QEK18640.1 Kinase A inhibitor [[Clostridium] hylemonae DSM 15053]
MEAKFLISGDSAVSVQMGSEISLEVNQLVRMLFLDLTNDPVEGIVEMVPTYASLMIHYRPEKIQYSRLKEEIEGRLGSMEQVEEGSRIVKEIPICYGGELGPDLEDCAAVENVSSKEFIRMHSEHEYYTYMLGFAPGHAYMARFEEPFHFKRRETPRVRIPGQSIVVQLNLSNLIPFDQPCGWNIVGATPLTICDHTKKDPFLVHAGEWVRYVPVGRREYEKIKEDVRRGTYRLKTYEKAVK